MLLSTSHSNPNKVIIWWPFKILNNRNFSTRKMKLSCWVPLSSTQGTHLFSHRNPSVPPQKPLSSTQPPQFHTKTPQFHTKNSSVPLPSVPHLKPKNLSVLVWNWGGCVELRGFRCGTEGFLGWKGVVQKWNWCVELRGSVWNWGVLFIFEFRLEIEFSNFSWLFYLRFSIYVPNL